MYHTTTNKTRLRSPALLAKFALLLGSAILGGHAQAQSTNIFLQAQPSATNVAPGDAVSILFSLNVNSLAAGDNYTAASLFFDYGSAPNGTTPDNIFAAVSLTPNTTSANRFSNSTLSNPSATATGGTPSTNYLGFSARQNSGGALRTDTGVINLTTASAVLRPDLAPGDYTLNFLDLGVGAGRTFISGSFSGAGNLTPTTGLGVNSVIFHVAAPVPEASSVMLLAIGMGMLGVAGLRSSRKGKTPMQEAKCAA